jgi:hypothetical protein
MLLVVIILNKMNIFHEDVEQVMKQKLSDLEPPRSAFNEVMNSVTSEDKLRYITRGDDAILSPYQLFSHFFMKKVLLIGTPVMALALVLIISAKSNTWTAPISEPVAVTESTKTNTDTPVVTTDSAQKTETKTSPAVSVSADRTIDDVFATLLADVEAETASLASEEEVTIITAELQDINNVKNANYEDLI